MLFLPILAAAVAIAFLSGRKAGRPAGERSVGPPLGVEGPETLAGFTASEAGVHLRLSPLYPAPFENDVQRRAVEARLGRTGELWRLEILVDDEAAAEFLSGELRVADGRGTALRPPSALSGESSVLDPLQALLSTRPAQPSAGRPLIRVLFGRRPGAESRLEAGGHAVQLSPTTLRTQDLPRPWVVIAERDAPPADGASSESAAGRVFAAMPVAKDADGARLDPRELELAELRALLERERRRRQERELEWHEFNKSLFALGVDGIVPAFPVADDYRPQEPADAPVDAFDEELARQRTARAVRLEELRLSLRALMKIEEVRGFDVLELGELGEDFVGPVVFRILDDRGRLAGSLSAARLHFEAARAARVVTFVFEDGSEARGGTRTPFETRRFPVPYVDPLPWLEALPELFSTADLVGPEDDGLWRVEDVRLELNRLLALDTSLGWYRLRTLGGVSGAELVEVQLEALDADGRIEKRLFADRMSIRREAPGIRLVLEEGAIVRGDEKTAFLQGRYEIYLARVDAEAWEKARLPGSAAARSGREPERETKPDDGEG